MISKEQQLCEKNQKSVQRLIMNNPIAMTLFIPQWDHGDLPNTDDMDDDNSPPPSATVAALNIARITWGSETHINWPMDESIAKSPGIAPRWNTIKQK